MGYIEREIFKDLSHAVVASLKSAGRRIWRLETQERADVAVLIPRTVFFLPRDTKVF